MRASAMAPRIAAVSGHVAGLVLMAAPSRPLLDILIEQNRRLAVLDDGKTSDAEREAIEALVRQVRAARDSAADPSSKSVLGLPVGYWRSIEAVDPVAEAKQIGLPMLVLCESPAQAEQLDDLLWSFDPDAYVPHQIVGADEDEEEVPVLLAAPEHDAPLRRR